MNKETGGPAFPGPYANDDGNIEVIFKQHGMTLRDYFAAKAIQAMLTGDISHYGYDGNWPHTDMAKQAYEMADQMLKVREA